MANRINEKMIIFPLNSKIIHDKSLQWKPTCIGSNYIDLYNWDATKQFLKEHGYEKSNIYFESLSQTSTLANFAYIQKKCITKPNELRIGNFLKEQLSFKAKWKPENIIFEDNDIIYIKIYEECHNYFDH